MNQDPVSSSVQVCCGTLQGMIDRIAERESCKRTVVKRIVQSFLDSIVEELGKLPRELASMDASAPEGKPGPGPPAS